MIKQDKILHEAREVEAQFKKLRAVIYQMCEDMDQEQDVLKKESMCKAIKVSMSDLDRLREKHEEILSNGRN